MEPASAWKAEGRLGDDAAGEFYRLLRFGQIIRLQHDQRRFQRLVRVLEDAAIDAGIGEGLILRTIVRKLPAERPGEKALRRADIAAGEFDVVDLEMGHRSPLVFMMCSRRLER